MASEPLYPIDDGPPNDITASEAEAISPPAAQPTVSAPEILADPGPDPIAAASTSESGLTSPPPSPADTDPASAAWFGPKSLRGGNMSMRVLSRAMQDLDIVTGGARAATYDEVDKYVGRAIRTERELEWVALRAQAAHGRSRADPTPLGGVEPGDGSPHDPVTLAPALGNAPPVGVGSQDSSETPGARQESPRPPLPETDNIPASNQPDAAPQDVATGAMAPSNYDPNFISVEPGGTGSLTQSFLGKASDPGAAQWLEGFVGHYGVVGVVDTFLQSGTMKDLTAVRDAATAYVAQDKSRTNTKLLADALSDVVNPKDDIVVRAPRRPSVPAPSADNRRVSVQVPTRGAGFRVYGNRNHQYATQRTIDALDDIARIWAQRHPDTPIEIGEMSLNGGGAISGHHSHRNGTDVDVRPFRTDGQALPVNRRSPAYDRERTLDFIRLVRERHPNVLVLFNDPVAIRQGLSRAWEGHDDHLHVRFR